MYIKVTDRQLAVIRRELEARYNSLCDEYVEAHEKEAPHAILQGLADIITDISETLPALDDLNIYY